jgi:hypothetical protein
VLAAPALARADVPDEIKVHVEGDPNLVVERRIENTDLWESVCTGTCDRKLPYTGRYRVLGSGIRESLWIALLPPQHDALKLDVKPAYTAAWAGGIALVSVGGAAMLVGAVVFTVGLSQNHFETPCSFQSNCVDNTPANNSMQIAGGMSLLSGAFIVGGGLAAILLGSQSRVRQIATVTFTSRGVGVRF